MIDFYNKNIYFHVLVILNVQNCIGDVMVSVLVSSVVDCGFIGDVMVSVLASIVVDCGFEVRLGQTKDYKTGICCFSAKHAALRRKSKESGYCVRMGRHVYPRTVVSMS